jgi:hypothetical protein
MYAQFVTIHMPNKSLRGADFTSGEKYSPCSGIILLWGGTQKISK